MQTAAAIGTQGPDGHAHQTSQLDQYLPAGSNVTGRGHFPWLAPRHAFAATGPPSQFPAKQPGDPHLNGLPNGHRAAFAKPTLNGSAVNGFKEAKDIPLERVQDRSQSGTRASHRPETNSVDGVANGLEITSSFIPGSNLPKSTSPLTFVNTVSSHPFLSDAKGTDSQPMPVKYRPRSSIPSRLPTAIYAQQCVAAAHASRLNPYALHRKEQEALQDHLCHLHVTVYLNIRNGILRLWTRNPMVSVSQEEAMGCAKDYRWMNLASFAYEWLVRNGYINFGCVEIPPALLPPKKGRRREGPVIVVIGAGMAGLGCARHLEGLFKHYHDPLTSPRVILLEGRRRIGGRIYSHPLRSLQSSALPPGLVPKVEMGAQIIVGFHQGNPLDQIIRGQLALPYHLLRDISTIYDIDGSAVDEARDATDEMLYNDILDRSGLYRHKSVIVPTAEGDRDMIDSGRDVTRSDGLTVRQYEEARAAGTIGLLFPAKRVRRGVGHKTAEIKSTGVPLADSERIEENPTSLACQTMGWALNDGVSVNDTVNLDPVSKASQFQTLGAVMNDGVRQYQRMLPLTPRDMRLLNWHMANLEYANAANIGKLSLSGWDQDMGNEFEGEHSQVIGGYQQLPYGLWSLPNKLDVRTNKIVSNITYKSTDDKKHKTVVHCEDGESFAADKVVFTGSLGVLKHRSIQFSPPLPDWKSGAIDRLGFGVMNKVILVFNEPFWDTERDMFGLLREPPDRDSMVQEEYTVNRGRFYLFWNCMKTTGLPVLIALMAGDAAHQAERTPDAEIIAEVTSQLRNVFKHVAVPDPLETIVTRWGTDKFTRGSYSYVAAQALPGDYDLMAKPIGNLHFAGEATCGTHPATVHGAYLSGLRAASEVFESIMGPVELPNPLVPEKSKTIETDVPSSSGLKRKEPSLSNGAGPSPNNARITHQDAYDNAMWAAIYSEIGHAPARPARTALNPFLLYQKDFWVRCRAQCDEARRAATKDPDAKAARDEIRQALGLMWRQADEAEKRPYLEQNEVNRQTNAEIWNHWRRDNADWEKKSYQVKERWFRETNRSTESTTISLVSDVPQTNGDHPPATDIPTRREASTPSLPPSMEAKVNGAPKQVNGHSAAVDETDTHPEDL
ncbi:lysine-specific histone demethylase Aof2 [Aspergillus heteromorphus CBS 117.55]|uniref:Lysine-specific histone demethylase Aof2 n=1 Tax=Aspergillus heteromorphus CBS 117.55 TaxID=1448321 RepID=A0A317W651_9EURO|nr:lysine-specific histone demethylase Aof2 [Aspergillus heteromorphus CBS 117.55]PWY80707.1 lysine-specific histone demethylase Aof2 [Aspergillus heteromorphus CBS 117.55]